MPPSRIYLEYTPPRCQCARRWKAKRPEGQWPRHRDLAALRALLRLPPEAVVVTRDRFARRYATAEIEVETLAPIEMLAAFAAAVEVPEEHREAVAIVDGAADGVPRIRTSPVPPAGAFASYRYRGLWFYVPEDDLAARGMISLVNLVLAVGAGDSLAPTPILTIPAE